MVVEKSRHHSSSNHALKMFPLVDGGYHVRLLVRVPPPSGADADNPGGERAGSAGVKVPLGGKDK
jgi:hypothetical protein